MKRSGEPIDVLVRDGRPRTIQRAGRRLEVDRVLERWVVQGRWWTREERRVYYRVVSGRRVMEIYRSGDRWVLSGILD